MSRAIALLGDTSDHGGSIVSSNQDGTVKVEGKVAAVAGAMLDCPVPGHGLNPILFNLAIKTFINGKAIVLNGSVAQCGAVIIASSVKTKAT